MDRTNKSLFLGASMCVLHDAGGESRFLSKIFNIPTLKTPKRNFVNGRGEYSFQFFSHIFILLSLIFIFLHQFHNHSILTVLLKTKLLILMSIFHPGEDTRIGQNANWLRCIQHKICLELIIYFI